MDEIGTTKTTRLSVNINPETAAALQSMAKKKNLTVTEIVRRAVALLDFVELELDKKSSIQIVDQGGRTRELFLL